MNPNRRMIFALDVNPVSLGVLETTVRTSLQNTVLLAGTSLNIDEAQNADPDVFILEMSANKDALYHLSRRLKSTNILCHIPIIVLTPQETNAAERFAALDAGVDVFLSTQFDAAELAALVKTMAKLKAANWQAVQPDSALRERICTLENELQERMQLEAALRESQAALDQILNTVPQSVFWKDRMGRYLGCNRVFAQAAGYDDPAQILGKTDYDLPWAEEGAPRFTADDRHVMESNQPKLHILEPLLAADGSKHWLDTSKVPLTDENGDVYAVLGIFEDITERRWVTYALDKFFDQPANLHLIAQLDSTIVRVNRGWEYVLGYTSEELEGTSFMALIHPNDLVATFNQVSRLEQGETVFNFENRYRHKDGHYRVLAWSALASMEDSMVFAVATDITDRRQAEAALQESEARYRSLLEQAPIGIAVHIDEKLTFVNPEGANLLGASSAAELIGLPITQFVQPSSHELLERRREDAYTQNTTMRPAEYGLVRLDGEEIEVEVTSTTFPFQGRMATQIIVRDITAQKRAESESVRLLAQVQAQAEQINQILDTVPAGVLLLDQEARVVLANPTALHDLQILAGAGIGDIVKQLGELPLTELLAMPQDGPWYEIHVDELVFEAVARPLAPAQFESGSGHWVIVLNDVTQEHALNMQLQQQERLAAVGQLAAGIAHDFNNILAIISLQGELAAQKSSPPESVAERLKVIKDQISQASRLVQQILDFGRRTVLDRRQIDLHALLQNQADLLAHALPEHIEVSLDCDPGDYIVMADATRIQQMVMNLALNARDAMPQGGKLCISLTREDTAPNIGKSHVDWIKLSITDTGTGIAPEIMPHLFEPFFTTKPRDRGTGLGLAQVYGIVKQHNGEINVTSSMGKGTTISINLPVALEPIEATAAPHTAFSTPANQTILLVEDNVILLDAMSEVLTVLGYSVLGAANGKEALAVLESSHHQIDLVLTDLVMPHMGGDALLITMRNIGMTTPVIVLSGHPLSGELETLREHGVIDWLPKPPNIKDLTERIAYALSHTGINQP